MESEEGADKQRTYLVLGAILEILSRRGDKSATFEELTALVPITLKIEEKSTKNKVRSWIQNALSYAIDQGILQKNPKDPHRFEVFKLNEMESLPFLGNAMSSNRRASKQIADYYDGLKKIETKLRNEIKTTNENREMAALDDYTSLYLKIEQVEQKVNCLAEIQTKVSDKSRKSDAKMCQSLMPYNAASSSASMPIRGIKSRCATKSRASKKPKIRRQTASRQLRQSCKPSSRVKPKRPSSTSTRATHKRRCLSKRRQSKLRRMR